MTQHSYLYRITTDKLLKFDSEGYVLVHSPTEAEGKDYRLVPMFELVDFEFIARYLVTDERPGYPDLSGSFLILEIDRTQLRYSSSKSRNNLHGEEYFGHLHESAINAVYKGEWIDDQENSVGQDFTESAKNNSLIMMIVVQTREKKPIKADVLTPEEIQHLIDSHKLKG